MIRDNYPASVVTPFWLLAQVAQSDQAAALGTFKLSEIICLLMKVSPYLGTWEMKRTNPIHPPPPNKISGSDKEKDLIYFFFSSKTHILPSWDSVPYNNHSTACAWIFWKPMEFRYGAGEIGRVSVLDWPLQQRTWSRGVEVRILLG